MTHHAAPKSIPLPSGTIDRVARAMAEVPMELAGHGGVYAARWDDFPQDIRERWRDRARAAITEYETARATTEKVK